MVGKTQVLKLFQILAVLIRNESIRNEIRKEEKSKFVFTCSHFIYYWINADVPKRSSIILSMNCENGTIVRNIG